MTLTPPRDVVEYQPDVGADPGNSRVMKLTYAVAANDGGIQVRRGRLHGHRTTCCRHAGEVTVT